MDDTFEVRSKHAGLALACAASLTWGAAAAAQAIDPPSSVQIIGARVSESADTGLATMRATRSVTMIERDVLDQWAPGRLEDLTPLVPGMLAESLNGGLSTAVKLRGYAVSRLLFNGLPDIQRLYVRDMATVGSVEVLRGPAAAQLGITSPGGVVHYVGKRPLATARQQFSASAGSDGYARLSADSGGPLGDGGLRYRLVAAAQDGQMSWQDLPLRHETVLAALDWAYGAGLVGIEFQGQHNRTPFSFGTVITNAGKAGSPVRPANIPWDLLYVAPGGAPAQRQYRQAALRWEHALTDGLRLQASAMGAEVERDEALLGYWSNLTATKLSGYYTRYHDSYWQRGATVSAHLQAAAWGWQHELTLGADAYRQGFLFTGGQNIGGFTLQVAAPDFSVVNPASLAMSPRYNDERIDEHGIWVTDRLRHGERVELALALRRQGYEIAADRKGSGRVPAADAVATAWSLGASWRVTQSVRAWYSAATGMEPNRGRTHEGGFLPAQHARQDEVGIEAATAGERVSLALWRVGLSNVAMTDPLDRNAVISAGSRSVRGVELLGSRNWVRWSLNGNVSLQDSRHVHKTSSSMGERFAGVPRASAGGQLEHRWGGMDAKPFKAWLGAVAVASRMGDAANTVRVPGFVRLDAGARATLPKGALQFGVRNLGGIRYVESLTAPDDIYQGARRRWWCSYTAIL